jgi:hypothetical protein
MFDFITVSSDVDQFCMNGANLEQISIEQSYDEVAKFDFSIHVIHNPGVDVNPLSCYFEFSHDVFDESTMNTVARRFHHLVSYLFLTNSLIQMDLFMEPIRQLSLILPEEAQEVYNIKFNHQTNIANECMSLSLFN